MQGPRFNCYGIAGWFCFVWLALCTAVLAWPGDSPARQSGNPVPVSTADPAAPGDDGDRIQPYLENPFYWQYKGEPVLLLGGSAQDNLFNHPAGLAPGGTLEAHLDILAAAGGNYVRNTMSHRDAGNEFAFKRLEDGRFDLAQWNPVYWQRFEDFLRMTAERDIIVQIEIWDPYDYHQDRREPQSGWSRNPFNPANNVNYTAQESNLPTERDIPMGAPGQQPLHPFFATVPALDNNTLVQAYQQAFVDKILEHTLDYSHVLYTMNNEIAQPIPEWGEYWIDYIRDRAARSGRHVETSDMYRMVDMSNPGQPWRAHYLNMVDKPEFYTFIEVGNNNARGNPILDTQKGWDNLMALRQKMSSGRPINNTKAYGGGEQWGGPDQGVENMWRNIMAGCASSRFHRPPWGIGLNAIAQANLRSMRMLTDEMSIFSSEPRNDLLSDRGDNEAYLLAEAGRQYAVYFPDGGAVTLDLSDAPGEWRLKWLNIMLSRWEQDQILQGGERIQISTPGAAGHWAALILKNNSH